MYVIRFNIYVCCVMFNHVNFLVTKFLKSFIIGLKWSAHYYL